MHFEPYSTGKKSIPSDREQYTDGICYDYLMRKARFYSYGIVSWNGQKDYFDKALQFPDNNYLASSNNPVESLYPHHAIPRWHKLGMYILERCEMLERSAENSL